MPKFFFIFIGLLQPSVSQLPFNATVSASPTVISKAPFNVLQSSRQVPHSLRAEICAKLYQVWSFRTFISVIYYTDTFYVFNRKKTTALLV